MRGLKSAVDDQRLASSNNCIASEPSVRWAAFINSPSWSTLLALTIGAVIAGCDISHASATAVGLVSYSDATRSSALRTFNPRASRYCASPAPRAKSEEHTSELQSLMRISYAVFCLKKKKHIVED